MTDAEAVSASSDIDDGLADDDEATEAVEPADEPPESPPTDVILDSGDAALTLGEANSLAAELGATVVLVAGAQEVGKTTMAVTLWSQFLLGPFAGFRFAGSRTLDAFDQRHFAARVSSGNPTADTARTEDEDLRLLHLRIADTEGRLYDLLPSDIRGEYFQDLVDGHRHVDGLRDLTRRADKVIVAIDGARVVALEERQQVVLEARLLLGRLTSKDWMHPDSPLLLLLTKVDLVTSAEDLDWYSTQEAGLLEFAKGRGLSHASAARLSARPTPQGLQSLLEWIQAPVARRPFVTASTRGGGRIFASGLMA